MPDICRGQESVFTYNTLGQPVTVQTPARGSAPAEMIAYTYDTNGRTLTVRDNRGVTTMAYVPGTDFVASVTDPVTGTTSYTYYVCGLRKTMTLPGGGTWTYTYTDSGLADIPKDDPESLTLWLSEITDDQGRVVEFSRTINQPLPQNAFGYHNETTYQLREVRSNEVFDSQGNLYSYLLASTDTDDQAPPVGGTQASLLVTHGWTQSVQTTWNWRDSSNTWRSRLVSSNAYTYDNAGNRLSNEVTTETPGSGGSVQYSGGTAQWGSSQTDGFGDTTTPATNEVVSSRTETYGYDDLTRLSSVNYGDGGTQAYTFDPMGNRLQRQDSTNGTTNYSYNAANMLTASTGAGASTYTNDADGDTLSGGGRGNTWDSQNRLASCTLNGQTSTFTYGADGLRRSMTVGGVTTYYVYDGQSMIREMQKNASGVLVSTATYLTGPRGPEYRRNDTQTESDGQGHTFGLTRWYVYDGLGSVVGEVDPLGNLICANEYDVYGAVRGRTGTATTAHGFVGSLGHLSDASTGLIYMRARYYDPSTGRFQSEDPGRNGDNWFAYANDNPVNMVDADGRMSQLEQDVLLAVGTGLLIAALFAQRAAASQTKYLQMFAQIRSATIASGLATAAVGCFALAAIGLANSDTLSAIGDGLTTFQGLITATTAAASETNAALPSGIAVGAAYLYSMTVLAFVIAAGDSDE